CALPISAGTVGPAPRHPACLLRDGPGVPTVPAALLPHRPPPGEQAPGDVLDGEGVAEVVPPRAVDVQLALAQPFFAEAELLDHPPALVVLGADAGLHPVESLGEEGVVDRQRDRGGHHPASGGGAVDPVADLRRTRRSPGDRADRDLADEPALLGDRPPHRDAVPALPY